MTRSSHLSRTHPSRARRASATSIRVVARWKFQHTFPRRRSPSLGVVALSMVARARLRARGRRARCPLVRVARFDESSLMIAASASSAVLHRAERDVFNARRPTASAAATDRGGYALESALATDPVKHGKNIPPPVTLFT